MKQDKLFRVQGDMKRDMQAQLARVLDAQQSSQDALLAALAARACGARACVLGLRVPSGGVAHCSCCAHMRRPSMRAALAFPSAAVLPALV